MKKWYSCALGVLFIFCQAAFATETAHSMWIKAKCAVCHGDDGSGNTPQGHSVGAPDLRSESVQKMTDAELAIVIRKGHSRMPSFKVQLDDQQVGLLVSYIRFVGGRK